VTPARLLLSCDHGLDKVLVEAISEPEARGPVRPLVQLLRRQPTWPGEGRLEIRINYPAGLTTAFAPGTAVRTVEELERAAALVWYAVDGGSVLLEWQRRTRQAVTDELAELSRKQPELPFA
jgi:hypothetical protein